MRKLERAKGFEPSTPTLARSCSTPELHPHPRAGEWVAAGRATYAKCGSLLQQRPKARKVRERTAGGRARTCAGPPAHARVEPSVTAIILAADCRSAN